MRMAHLLAFDGTEDNQRQGRLGRILHDFSKWMIRGAVDRVHNRMKDVIDYKKKNGWIKDHIAAMDEGWKWVQSLDEMPINGVIGGFKGPGDLNRKLFGQLGEICFTHLDEDSFYDIHFLLWLKWVHEHWERFEQSAESAYQILNFGNLYKDLLSYTEPLPVDDGSDENDEPETDYIALEKRLKADKDGME